MASKPYTPREMKAVAARLKATLLHAKGEGETIDVLGDFRSLETAIADLRKGTAAEFENGMQGKRWRFVQGRTSKRTYNTPTLIRKFSEATGESLFDTLLLLLRYDALRISWQYMNLERAAAQCDVTLMTAQHEVHEGDDADMGVYWKSAYPSYKPVD